MADPSTPKRKLSWWQFVVPLLVLVLLFGVVLPQFIYYAAVWEVPRESGVRAKLQRRLFALAAVLGSGVLLTLVIFAETLVGTLDSILASGTLDTLLKITSSVVPALLGGISLAVLFKYTLDLEIAWRSVWLAAVVTIVMLSVGTWGYGIYLNEVGFKSASGVAGTLLLGLALVYYSAQILLYGVEVTREVHARSEHAD